MYKKITSLMLVFLMCCLTIFSVSCQTEYSNAETVDDDSEQSVGPLDAPDEILSASTAELLEYFMKSSFMHSEIMSSCLVSTPSQTYNRIDYSCHKAYSELVSRENFLDVLESYAKSVLNSIFNCELDVIKAEKFVAQPAVKSLLPDFVHASDDYPNLQYIYTSSVSSSWNVEENVTIIDFDSPDIDKEQLEHLKQRYCVSGEVLSSSTAELLNYFMESRFMQEQSISAASTPEVALRVPNYSNHEAFRELLSREELIAALENYSETVLCSLTNHTQESIGIKLLLAQPIIEALVFSEHNIDNYPNLQTMYADVLSSSTWQYLGSSSDIKF